VCFSLGGGNRAIFAKTGLSLQIEHEVSTCPRIDEGNEKVFKVKRVPCSQSSMTRKDQTEARFPAGKICNSSRISIVVTEVVQIEVWRC
jgi:hypothetical protein